MKKLLLVVVFGISVFGGVIYYQSGINPWHDGREQLTQDGLKGTLNKISSAQIVVRTKQFINEIVGNGFTAPAAKTVQVYKWTDAKGVVHYDNQPVKGAKIVDIDPDNNVLSMTKAPDVGTTDKPRKDEATQATENVEKMRAAIEARAGI